MFVLVNLVFLCGIIVVIIVFFGRINVLKVYFEVYEVEGDVESVLILCRDFFLLVLVRNGLEEVYGMFDDLFNGK